MLANTLVLGLAAGLHYGDVRPFAVSLDRTGYAGECVLFVTSTTTGLDRLRERGVLCVSFERPPDQEHVPYNAYRYFLYLGFLRASPVTYRRVLLTDVRDVVFQEDPFARAWPEGLNLFLEDGPTPVADCAWTSRWIGGHLGGSALAEIADRPVSCSGVTIGSHAAILGYLERLCSLLLPFTPGERMAGYDQGVHNHLLYTGRLSDLSPSILDNTGPVLTLGRSRKTPRIAEDGSILNALGQPATIIHQYDRFADLHRLVRARYEG